MKNKTGFFCFTYLDLKKTNLFGQDRKRIMISMVNQALQTHSTKKNASWALVWYLSNVQAVELKEVRTVIFLITGTRISGWVLRQKETIDTTIKNTEMIPITWNVLRKKLFWLFLLRIGIYYLSTYVAKVSHCSPETHTSQKKEPEVSLCFLDTSYIGQHRISNKKMICGAHW